jgi:hypothetical protein
VRTRIHIPTDHKGGCICGDVRYKTTAEPLRVTICHCTFCQRFTGSAFLVEPIFRREDVAFFGAPRIYDHRSDSSNKRVSLNFCGRCGTTLYLDLERFPDILGLCGGTFDDPNWFDRGPGKCRHIFTRSAQNGVVLPAGLETFREHAFQTDGTPNEPIVLAHALVVAHDNTTSTSGTGTKPPTPALHHSVTLRKRQRPFGKFWGPIVRLRRCT